MALQLEETVSFLRSCQPVNASIAIVLGTGLGEIATKVIDKVSIPYTQIPHFPVSTVPGHEGNLVMGYFGGKPVMVMQGRFHYYEGYDLAKVTYPIRVMARLGVRTVILTNAAGSINERLRPGDLMVLADHINLMGVNPLRGITTGPLTWRFPDLTNAYDPFLRQSALRVGAEKGFSIQEGIYAALAGPSYETPAEIRFLRLAGADAVGMSTVPEVIVARQEGLNVLAISCISNWASGVKESVLDHEQIFQVVKKAQTAMLELIEGVLEKIPEEMYM